MKIFDQILKEIFFLFVLLLLFNFIIKLLRKALFILTLILIAIKLLYKYKVLYQKYQVDEKKDKFYKVKRKYLNNSTYLLNEKKLVPGDVIFMNVGQNCPCDCL